MKINKQNIQKKEFVKSAVSIIAALVLMLSVTVVIPQAVSSAREVVEEQPNDDREPIIVDINVKA